MLPLIRGEAMLREGNRVTNVRAWTVASLTAAAMILAGETCAKTLTVEQATELLARSVAANGKCKVLPPTEASRLQNYAVQAERRLLELRDEQTAKRVVASGRKIGAAVRCDDTTANAINAIFKAAQTAVIEAVPSLRGSEQDEGVSSLQAAASTDQTDDAARQVDSSVVDVVEGEASNAMTPPPEPENGVVPVSQEEDQLDAPAREVDSRKAKKPNARQQKAAAQSAKKPPVKPAVPAKTKVQKKETADAGILSSYGRLAQQYYLERRCQNLARGSMASLYGKVLSSHRAAVAQFGTAPVRATLRKAEARAAAQSC